MHNRNPVIVTGVRSPGQDALGVSAQAPEAAAATRKDGVRRYSSGEKKGFRLMLLDEPNKVFDGMKIPGRRLSAQFNDGLYETDDPEKIRLIEVSKAFKTHQVVDADVIQAEAESASKAAALRTVMADPALMAAVRERLSLKGKGGPDSFELPPPTTDEGAQTGA